MANIIKFDVAILGSGMAGSIMAAVLAKQGVRVVLIDSDTHPRFVVGESTIPHTSLLISLLDAFARAHVDPPVRSALRRVLEAALFSREGLVPEQLDTVLTVASRYGFHILWRVD